MNRNLDGVYFRIKRNEKFENICWSDLSDEEMDDILSKNSSEFAGRLCKILGHTLKDIGDQLDLYME